MIIVISSDDIENIYESEEYMDIANEKLDEFFYEVTKYLNENEIDPKTVGWVFY